MGKYHLILVFYIACMSELKWIHSAVGRRYFGVLPVVEYSGTYGSYWWMRLLVDGLKVSKFRVCSILDSLLSASSLQASNRQKSILLQIYKSAAGAGCSIRVEQLIIVLHRWVDFGQVMASNSEGLTKSLRYPTTKGAALKWHQLYLSRNESIQPQQIKSKTFGLYIAISSG